MNIFQDAHFYLVLSFVIMVVLLYKKVYKSIDNSLNANINNIKNEITNLRNKRDTLQSQVSTLKQELGESSAAYQEKIQKVKADLKSVIEVYNKQYNGELEKQKYANREIYKKIETETSVKINKKLKELILQEVIQRINNIQTPEQFNLINLQKSLNMLEEMMKQSQHYK